MKMLSAFGLGHPKQKKYNPSTPDQHHLRYKGYQPSLEELA